MEQREFNRMKELLKKRRDAVERIEQLKAYATRTTALLDGLPRGSAMRSKVEESIVKLQTVISELENECVELIALQNQFRAELERLEPMKALILQMRYLDGKGFRLIAHTLSLSTPHVFDLHRRGLKIILKSEQNHSQIIA